ncbi:SPH-1 protein [Aphelenchoides avenae]|nr:SPH-1 protein [Aphelenchus avenae]
MAFQVQQLNIDQLKVPLGFIKVLEVVFALIAFAALNGWRFELDYMCAGESKKRAFETTTFSLASVQFPKCGAADNATANLFDNSFGGVGGFFAFVSIASVFFALAMLFVYLYMWGLYAGDDRVPQIDLLITMLLAVAWFIATWSWWWSANGLESATVKENVEKLMQEKGFNATNINAYAVYAPVTVSIMAGFACLVLFASNVWFTYKETSWFRNRQVRQPPPTHTLS